MSLGSITCQVKCSPQRRRGRREKILFNRKGAKGAKKYER
jgi:hypothetical protein